MKMAKRKNWKHELHNLFVDSWNLVKEQKKFIYAVIGVFLAGSLIGFIQADTLAPYFKEIIGEIIDKTQGLDFLEMFWFIFSNNITSSLVALLFGVLFGIFPLMTALFNGALLGYVYSEASALAGYGVIWRLIPHGIFELPAIFISLGLGVYVGSALFGKDKIVTVLARLKNSFRAFLTVVFLLLAIAALIESALIVYAV
ncbi:MAG: stage II sporulation protein M [Candidatus Pacearchaeota archaeon]